MTEQEQDLKAAESLPAGATESDSACGGIAVNNDPFWLDLDDLYVDEDAGDASAIFDCLRLACAAACAAPNLAAEVRRLTELVGGCDGKCGYSQETMDAVSNERDALKAEVARLTADESMEGGTRKPEELLAAFVSSEMQRRLQVTEESCVALLKQVLESGDFYLLISCDDAHPVYAPFAARQQLEAENARLAAEVARLNDVPRLALEIGLLGAEAEVARLVAVIEAAELRQDEQATYWDNRSCTDRAKDHQEEARILREELAKGEPSNV
jgi:cell division protein FtsB